MNRVPTEKVYRLFYPAVPMVVASFHAQIVAAMPVVSVLHLSNSPCRIALAAFPTSTTYQTLMKSKRFSLSWLDSKLAGAVEFLGSTSGRVHPDKLKAARLEYRKDVELGLPILEDAVAYLACNVAESKPMGDHDLVVADVIGAYANDDFSEYWKFVDYHPILYVGMPDHLRTYGA